MRPQPTPAPDDPVGRRPPSEAETRRTARGIPLLAGIVHRRPRGTDLARGGGLDAPVGTMMGSHQPEASAEACDIITASVAHRLDDAIYGYAS